MSELAERFQLAVAAVVGDRVARIVFLLAALSVFAILGFIVFVLLDHTWKFFAEVSVVEFLTARDWRASEFTPAWGVQPLLMGTLLVTVGACLIGLPIGLATAIYLAEYASPRIRRIVKPALELLAGIPSIVFGFFALQVVSPWLITATAPGTFLHAIFGDQAGIFSALSAIIVVGIMVLPIITSMSEDAIRAVPQHLREASLGMGATRWETTRKVVVPAAVSGITASFVLGVARAIGETMAVTLAAGTNAKWTFNPIDAIQTMTAFIVQRTSGDTPQDGAVFESLFAVGLTLFVMTLSLNLLAQRFVKRYREVE